MSHPHALTRSAAARNPDERHGVYPAEAWKKVQAAMQQPHDALIVEGYPVHESRFARITVDVTQVTTNAVHAAKRKEQPAPVNEG